MPSALRGLVCVAGLLALLACPAAARGADAEWAMAPLPGGRTGLLPQIGLAPDVPLGLALGEAIRVIHASRDTDSEAALAVRRYFAAPPDGSEPIPLPLDLAAWRPILGSDVTSDTLIPRLLANRRASLLCYGLLQLDPATLGFVAGDAGLLRRLYDRHSGIFAGFGQAIRIQDGQLALPGGDAARPAWATLFGDELADPPHAIMRALEADDGRLLYFLDTVTRLDEARQALVLRDRPDDEPGDRLRSVYRTFTRIEPGWRLGDFPFVRLGADPALMLGSLRLDEAGQLRHSQAFWEVVLGGRTLVKDHRERWEDLGSGDRVEPAWLLDRITNTTLPQRLEAAQIHAFAERLTDRLSRAPMADIAFLSRAYRRFPALLLELERLAIDDVDVLIRLVTHASRLGAVTTDIAQLERALTLFQAPLQLVTRARQVHAIDADKARALVASLSNVAPEESGFGRALGAWFDAQLLPALGYDASVEGASPEASLLEALAGLRSPRSDRRDETISWESNAYRVDLAAPELARLTDVRGLQGGNTLDTALALGRIGAMLGGKDPAASAQSAAAALRLLLPSLLPIEPSERTTASPPEDVVALVTGAVDELARVRGRGDGKRIQAVAARLARAEDAVLADVLTSLIYALWLGDPQGQAFLAGNVARRHDFGLRLLTGSDRQETPWQLPLETSGSGEPWHLRGALVGLDVGLSRLAMRRTRMDLPDKQPTLNESDRRTLVTTLALTSPFDLDQPSADRVVRGLRAGREIAARPAMLEPRLTRLCLDGRRREAVRWTARRNPADVVNLLLRTELVLLGRDDDAPLPPAWGQADTARTGCLCLVFPDPPAIDRVMGRPGTGLVTSRIADLKLRVLEELDALRLPAELARGVLASATQDYLDDVRPAHGDDWLTLARHVDRVPRERFDDYVAALTAGGPLVPTAPVAASTNGHE